MQQKKIYKRIWAAIMILMCVVLLEVWFNYPALTKGYEPLDLTDRMYMEIQDGEEYDTLRYYAPESIYVKQFQLSGTVTKRSNYTITVVGKNDFGKEVETIIEDTVSPWFFRHCTNVNREVTKITFSMCRKAGAEIAAISLLNTPEINFYRVAFFAIAFLLLYCALFEKKLREKVEWYFALFALAFGLLMGIVEQPQSSVWDENNHFWTAYRMAQGREIQWNEAAQNMASGVTAICNTKEEYDELRAMVNEKGNTDTVLENRQDNIISISSLSYIPAAIFVKLGMAMNLSFSKIYFLGKLGNLLSYILIMFLAIRIAKAKKFFLAFIAMMPTSLFLACSYSYDGAAFSLTTLGCVLWANEAFCEKERYRWQPVLLSILLIAVGSSSKGVYFPMALAVVMLPQIGKMEKTKKRILAGICTAMVLAVLVLVIVPYGQKLLTGEISFSDPRGGDTSTSLQLASMLEHPLKSIRMLFENIVRMDNFRNTQLKADSQYLISNLMFLNYYNKGVLPNQWSLVLIPILVLLVLFQDEKEKDLLVWGRGKRTVMSLFLLMSVVLIWLALYLGFTPVGEEMIMGVQPRYYLPLLYFAVLLLRNGKTRLVIDKERMTSLTLISVNLFESVSVYEFLLKNRLF